MPCSTSSTLRRPPVRPSAYSCRCWVASVVPIRPVAVFASALPAPANPGVAAVGTASRSTGPRGSRRRFPNAEAIPARGSSFASTLFRLAIAEGSQACALSATADLPQVRLTTRWWGLRVSAQRSG